ncbi:class I SAM-dependent methyltransferase [Halorussus caseinilyticus]|uniref:class I SAM-dependent methyltransferase n=1 Tax=Halorussus caseinilyticus TaxID=3034025 RepID=UPI0023E7F5D6|nr:class I SAM-dependent methyltransferase [Halorussus sp. DT72]
MDHDRLGELYGRDDYYWGTEPNDLAETALGHLADPEEAVVADVGAGEGRDAVFFAERGATVYAIDPIAEGLEKAERLAADRDVEVRTRVGDVNDLELPETVDLFYSIGTVQYLQPENRAAQFDHFHEATRPGGVHAVFAFVDHPEVPTPPDWGDNEHFYEQGELRGYYDDWDVLDESALVFDDDSGGEPHRHAAEIVTARKS